LVPSYVCVRPRRDCGGALLLPRHRHGAALLNDERPATRGANGSRAFLGEDFGQARAAITSGPGGSVSAKFLERLMGDRLTPSSRGRSPAGSRAPRPRFGGPQTLTASHGSRLRATPNRRRAGESWVRTDPGGDDEASGDRAPAIRRLHERDTHHGSSADRTGPCHTVPGTFASTRSKTPIDQGLRPRRPRREVWTPRATNERRAKRLQQITTVTSASNTVHKRGFFEVLRAPSCSLGDRPAISVVSGPVWSGEVAVQQRAINRGFESYHSPPTRQAKTEPTRGIPIVSAWQPDPRRCTARLRQQARARPAPAPGYGAGRPPHAAFPTPGGPTSPTAVRAAYPSPRAAAAPALDEVTGNTCKNDEIHAGAECRENRPNPK
jgi:hypothetical protein